MIDRNASAKKRNEHGQVITRGKPMLKVRSAVRTETGVRQATNTAHISEIVGSECSRAQQIAADTEAFGDNLVSSEVTKGFQRRTWHLLANVRKVIATQSAVPTDCSFWCVPVLESPPPERGRSLA